jgi:hypothetical protein
MRGAHHDTRDTEAALHAAFEHERFADDSPGSLGKPVDVSNVVAAICSGLRRHDSAGLPSIITRQQPHAPSGAHPFLHEVMPHSSAALPAGAFPVRSWLRFPCVQRKATWGI